MKAFNAQLPVGSVVVAVDHRYNDNDGAYSVAWVFDGEFSLTCESYANGYNNRSFDDAEVDATPVQIACAAELYATNKLNLGRVMHKDTLIGCVVSLKRSRKAPNRVALEVIDHADAYYDSAWNRHVDAQVCVQVPNVGKVWVSASCVDVVLRGAYPWWKPTAFGVKIEPMGKPSV